MITKFALFERKGNYNLYHKTNDLFSILKDGYIKAGSDFDTTLRKNVITDWKPKKYKIISATRNFNYMDFPSLELDVEKISDNYKIIPFSENPDFYLAFLDDSLGGENKYGNMKPSNIPHMTSFQNKIRSKSKGAGELYWRTKTDKDSMDFGISEELILADKLDVDKYVKNIYMSHRDNKIEKLVKKKYPHINIIVLGWDHKLIHTKQKQHQKSLQNA